MQFRSPSHILAERLLILTISLVEEAEASNVDEMNFLLRERHGLLSELECLEIESDAAHILSQVRHQEQKLLEVLQESKGSLTRQLAEGARTRRGIEGYLAN